MNRALAVALIFALALIGAGRGNAGNMLVLLDDTEEEQGGLLGADSDPAPESGDPGRGLSQAGGPVSTPASSAGGGGSPGAARSQRGAAAPSAGGQGAGGGGAGGPGAGGPGVSDPTPAPTAEDGDEAADQGSDDGIGDEDVDTEPTEPEIIEELDFDEPEFIIEQPVIPELLEDDGEPEITDPDVFGNSFEPLPGLISGSGSTSGPDLTSGPVLPFDFRPLSLPLGPASDPSSGGSMPEPTSLIVFGLLGATGVAFGPRRVRADD